HDHPREPRDAAADRVGRSVGTADGHVRDVTAGNRAAAVGDAAALAAGVGLDGDVVGGAARKLGREGEGTVGAHGQVVAAVVLQDEAAGETADGAADGVGRVGRAGDSDVADVGGADRAAAVGDAAALAAGVRLDGVDVGGGARKHRRLCESVV